MNEKTDAALEETTQDLADQKLWLKILIGMGLGIIAGAALSPEITGILETEFVFALGEWLALPGVIFLGLIQMVIVPLIICSIILGIAGGGNITFLKKMGARIVPYFILTTAVSITIGIAIVSIIQPGSVMDPSFVEKMTQNTQAVPAQTFEDLSIPERIGNIIPTNPAKAEVDRNMLQIVIAAILVGIALIMIPTKQGRPFAELCEAGQMLSMKIISWAMRIAPYAVFGLLANVTIRTGLDSIYSVGLYTFCVLAGLLCMMIVYIILASLIGKMTPMAFLAGIREPQLLAFSTSSSAATMPFSIKAAEENLKLRPEIGRFIVPLGVTINMDGTAMYQGIAAVFLTQVFGVDLTLSETILLIITTVGASIGTPGTPGVGLVVLATILVSVGVPPEGIALILGVDRLLDMCRTTINVTGDLTASVVMDKLVK